MPSSDHVPRLSDRRHAEPYVPERSFFDRLYDRFQSWLAKGRR